MKELIEKLTALEADAKQLADVHPKNPHVQILRARLRSALEITEHIKLEAPEAAAPESTAKKK